MHKRTAEQLIAAGAILLFVWFVAVVLRFLVGIAFLLGLVLVIVGAIVYATSPRQGPGR